MKYLFYISTIALLLVTGCNKEEPLPTALDGTWYKYTAVGKYIDFDRFLTFKADGTGSYQVDDTCENFYWDVNGFSLILTYDCYTVGYRYRITEPYLFLSTETVNNTAFMRR